MRTFKNPIAILILMLGVLVVPSLSQASTYNGDLAAYYASLYCGDDGSWSDEGYNENYVSFYFDCTNFVSQCLFAGGWQEVGSDVNSTSSWFYNGESESYISKTWRLVDYLQDFLESSGRAYGPVAVTEQNKNMFYPGDVVLFDEEGDNDVDRAFIVTEYTGGFLYMMSHTTNRCPIATTAVANMYPGSVMRGYFIYSYY